MIIREATPDDSEFLRARLHDAMTAVHPEPLPPPDDPEYAQAVRKSEAYQQALGGGEGITLIAEEKGERLGAAWYRFFSADRPGYGFIREDIPELTIAVAPEHRGKHAGKRLLQALTEQARKNGVKYLSLNVEYENVRARRLYAALGFILTKTLSDGSLVMLKETN
jgi:ribosomal protein S18 acetylase RimI-like enzyme